MHMLDTDLFLTFMNEKNQDCSVLSSLSISQEFDHDLYSPLRGGTHALLYLFWRTESSALEAVCHSYMSFTTAWKLFLLCWEWKRLREKSPFLGHEKRAEHEKPTTEKGAQVFIQKQSRTCNSLETRRTREQETDVLQEEMTDTQKAVHWKGNWVHLKGSAFEATDLNGQIDFFHTHAHILPHCREKWTNTYWVVKLNTLVTDHTQYHASLNNFKYTGHQDIQIKQQKSES